MKKTTAILLSLVIVSMLSISAFASTAYDTYVVTEENTVVHERANPDAPATVDGELLTYPKGLDFTPIGETENFWQIEYVLPPDRETIHIGYILKVNAEKYTESTEAPATTSSSSTNQPPAEGWVSYSSGNLDILLSNIARGNVVYYNGQYWASPEFYASILASQQ